MKRLFALAIFSILTSACGDFESRWESTKWVDRLTKDVIENAIYIESEWGTTASLVYTCRSKELFIYTDPPPGWDGQRESEGRLTVDGRTPVDVRYYTPEGDEKAAITFRSGQSHVPRDILTAFKRGRRVELEIPAGGKWIFPAFSLTGFTVALAECQ